MRRHFFDLADVPSVPTQLLPARLSFRTSAFVPVQPEMSDRIADLVTSGEMPVPAPAPSLKTHVDIEAKQ